MAREGKRGYVPHYKPVDTDFTRSNCEYVSKPFIRNDGSLGKDKTKGLHSRPGKKQALRQANRALIKRARQTLKRLMMSELDI